LFVAVALEVGACRDTQQSRFEFESPHMGTRFRIVLYTADESAANAASRAAFDRIAYLDSILSDYDPESELMQLCAKAGGPAVRVSDELFHVLNRAQQLAAASDGSFDVSVGPVIRLWRRARRQRKLPDPNRLADARALVGYQKIRLDEPSQSVQLARKRMQLDLGGIAKGYAADEAMATLKRHNVSRALIAAGGDIVVSDPPPDKPFWTVAVTSPGSVDQAPIDYLGLRNAAVSTSGDLEQFMELDGKRYSHIIDPKSGSAITERRQVTVVAPNGTLSDGLATAVSVLGVDRGWKLIEATPGSSAMILEPGTGGPKRTTSSRYEELRVQPPAAR
jgi:thiamine biosynthesis lipoprotein